MSGQSMSVSMLMLKSGLLGLVLTIFLLFITSLALFIVGWHKLGKITSAGNTTNKALLEQVWSGWHIPLKASDDKTTFLILGLDAVPGRDSSAVLSDSIILVGLNYQSGKINLLSFPRDIWSDVYQTRINALYTYGREQTPSHPTSLLENWLSETTNTHVDYRIVITPQDLTRIINALDGIEIDVPVAFKDTKYPITAGENTNQQLYQTIEFVAGRQTMSGERALKYIRSRYSDNESGTDQNRGLRQQLVLEAIITKLQQPTTWKNEARLKQFFSIYQSEFNQDLPLNELIAIGKAIWPVRQNISLALHQLTVESAEQTGVIYHPPTWQTAGQWLYYVRDDNLLKQLVNQYLYE